MKPGRQEVESVAALSVGRIAMGGYGNEIETPQALSWNLWEYGNDDAGLGCNSVPVSLTLVSVVRAMDSDTTISDLSLAVQTVTADRVVNAPAEDLCRTQRFAGGEGPLFTGGSRKNL